MSILKKIKQSYNNYLARLAKSNKEVFGDGALECCKLNRPQNNKNLKD